METVSKQLQSRLSDDDDRKESTSSTATMKTIDTQAVAMERNKYLPSKDQ